MREELSSLLTRHHTFLPKEKDNSHLPIDKSREVFKAWLLYYHYPMSLGFLVKIINTSLDHKCGILNIGKSNNVQPFFTITTLSISIVFQIHRTNSLITSKATLAPKIQHRTVVCQQ